MKSGILLSNLGSPDAPTPAALKIYLDQFLMDPSVIDVPYWLRALLVRGIVLRTRPKQSALAYQKIWTENGSPLLVNTLSLTEKVQRVLGDRFSVKFAMRYGNPSFENVLAEFAAEGVESVSLLPLYPQWAMASTGSTMAHLKEVKSPVRVVDWLQPFSHDADFIDLWVNRFRSVKIAPGQLRTHYLFSFHGIPERHIRKTPGCSSCKFKEACCLAAEAPPLCYRSQCEKTAHAIAAKLSLTRSEFSVSFQSRLGPDQWLTPFTDKVLEELPKKGIERLVMFSPAFSSDCLETLEELDERGRESFMHAGGRDFYLVPSLNDGDDFANLLATWIKSHKHFDVVL